MRSKAVSKRERIWNIIGVLLATILVGYVLYSAWMKASGQW
ncbi:flagellar basal body-associated protein FliL [Curtobacterium sp. SORGH_AS776]|nr:flagellar basal body-associated protein FliL [Curtobacterium sp. SORGH_AS_0776]